MTRLPLSLGIELDEALRQILGGCLGPVGGLAPLRAAQLIEPGVLGILPGPDILAHQIQRRGRHIQAVAAGIGDLDVVLLHPVGGHPDHPHEAADAMVLMHHQIAGGQVGVGLELLPIAVPLGAGLFGLACQRRGQLTLRQHRQL